MADWPFDNAAAGLLAPGRQLWRMDPPGRVEIALGDAPTVALDLADPAQARLAALAGARLDDGGRVWPGGFRFSPLTGAPLMPALPSAEPWGAPAGGGAGLPQTDAIVQLDPATRAEHLAPTQAILFVAGAPAALYGLRTALGVLEVFLPRGGAPSADDWLRLGVAVRAGVELPAWSAAVAAGRFGFAVATAAGPVCVRLPRLPGATGGLDAAPAGVRSVGGVASAGGQWLAPVRADERLALLSRRADAWSEAWRWVELDAAPAWPEPTSPAGVLSAPATDGRDDVFWVGREGYLAWSPAEARAGWTPWPAPFRALPMASPWRSGDGVLWQQGEEAAPEGPRLVFRPLRFGGASAEARPVRNPHFSAGSWTYASSGRPARWLRPWDRVVEDEQLRTPEGAVLAPLLGFDDRSGDPATLLAQISGEGAHAGALVRGEPPGLVRAALKQHRSRQPVEDLGAAFQIGRLDDLQVIRYAERVFVAHRDEPGDYAQCYSWRALS